MPSIIRKRINYSSSGGASETINEVLTNGNTAVDKTLVLQNSTDNGTMEIDSFSVTQRFDDGAGLGNFAQLAGGTLQMSETNADNDNNAYVGPKHMNMSSVDSNGDPLNHFSMEWSDVASVNMSADLKAAWRTALDVGSGSGNADFDITPEHNLVSTSANGEHLIFDFTETDTLTARASIPGSWEKERILATKNYVDGKAGVKIAVGKETWYGTYTDENDVTYQVYSKTVYIPALPSTAGITTYNHGVSNIKQVLSIYGFTTDGFVLNAPRQVTSDNITIYQASKSSTNQTFSIEVGKDRSSKSAYVTMIYAKNN